MWYNNKDLTTGDLTKLFDTELKMDYINGEDVQVLKDMMPVSTIAMLVGSALVMSIVVSAAGYAAFSKKDMD